MTLLSEIYDVTLKRENRGASNFGWVRPTVGEFFVTNKDFQQIPSSLFDSYGGKMTFRGIVNYCFSSNTLAGSNAFHAFDDAATEFDSGADTTTTLGYRFPYGRGAVRLNKVVLRASTNASKVSHMPNHFQIRGSNSGEGPTDGVLLMEVDESTNDNYWSSPGEEKEFEFLNNTDYVAYYIVMLNRPGDLVDVSNYTVGYMELYRGYDKDRYDWNDATITTLTNAVPGYGFDDERNTAMFTNVWTYTNGTSIFNYWEFRAEWPTARAVTEAHLFAGEYGFIYGGDYNNNVSCTFIINGSNNGTDWTLLDSTTVLVKPSGSNDGWYGDEIVFTNMPDTPYLHHAIRMNYHGGMSGLAAHLTSVDFLK